MTLSLDIFIKSKNELQVNLKIILLKWNVCYIQYMRKNGVSGIIKPKVLESETFGCKLRGWKNHPQKVAYETRIGKLKFGALRRKILPVRILTDVKGRTKIISREDRIA